MNYECYNKSVNGFLIDPYRVILEYKIAHPAQQHATKKLLRAGRSHKTLDEDIQEVIDTCVRWQEMRKEDAED